MITEDRMRFLLQSAAAVHDPPPDGPAGVLATAAGAVTAAPPNRGGRVPPWRRLMPAGVAAVAAVAIGLAAFDGGVERSAPAALRTSVPTTGPTTSSLREDTASYVFRGGQSSRDPAATAAAQFAVRTNAGQAPAAAAQAATTADGPTKVVKTATISVEVAKGRFDAAVAGVTTLAAGNGGYVSNTSTTSDKGVHAGFVTVRVPADRFESVATGARRLGRVQQSEIHGNDVTAEYADTEARVRALTTSRDALLKVLAATTSVADNLTVQDRLNTVQTQIEEQQGRQRVLDDQAALASVNIGIREPGAATAVRKVPATPSSWRKAADGFTGTLADVVSESGTALAIVLLGAGLLVVLMALSRWAYRAYVRFAV